jgi:hypothetical protein
MRRAGMTVLVLVALSAGAACLAPSAAAVTRWVTEQGSPGKPFTFEPLSGALAVVETAESGQDLRLADVVLGRIDRTSPVYGGEYPDPRSVEVLTNGDLLFADRSGGMVAEVTPAGVPVWKYSRAQDAGIGRPFSAQRFSRGGQDYTLIADRDAYRVWAVDRDYQVVWQYGVTGEKGLGANHLMDPFYARYSPEDGGTVLIADNLNGYRVIEIRYSDYLAGAPDNGFTSASITWSYGEPGVSGNGPGRLSKPHSAQRLASGNVLICDAGDDVSGARVLEIDRVSGAVAWEYGVTGPPGSGDGYLQEANFATRLPDGDTLIADTLSGRVLRVTQAKSIEQVWDQNEMARPEGYGSGSSSPRAAAFTDDGRLVVADSVFQQIAFEGHEGSATATSTALDCGRAGVDKAFVSLTWKGDTGETGTSVIVEYRVGAGSWKPCAFTGGSRRYDFRAGTHGLTISYRVTLKTQNAARTPVLDGVIIQSTRARTGGAGGGGGGDKPGGSGNSGQSGSYTYPSTAQGGTGASGTGTGSGSYGSGSGSGTTGSGTSASTSGSGGSGTVVNSVDVPVQSSGSGGVQDVQGYQVQGEEGVSGVPLRAEQGAQAPEPGRPGPSVPVLALLAAGLFVAAAFFVPWPFVAARMRSLTGFDHTRPKRFLPFRPLGK